MAPTASSGPLENACLKMGYIELHARSAFSFLRGASTPDSLARHAANCDLPALALTDRDGFYGIPRLHRACAEHGIRPITGTELTLEDGSVLPVLVRSQEGYRNLCRLLTRAHLRSPKGFARIRWHELAEAAPGLVALTGDHDGPLHKALRTHDTAFFHETVTRLRDAFGKDNLFVELQRHLQRGEEQTHAACIQLANAHGLPLLATGGVTCATRNERELLDLLTCMRLHTHLDEAGRALAANAECHLRPPAQMQRLFAHCPEAVSNSVHLAHSLSFTLADLGYAFPEYAVPPGETMESFLRTVTLAGARARYSHLSRKVRHQLEHELDLICRLGFAGYFLIVWDIVNFCSANNILVQGRGSAANSAVCYSLGITACDPIAGELLFERFLSEGRTSWPDIDLDLPSGTRREAVIQELYRRHAPEGAAMTANVITFRGRSAMREIGKALNFPPAVLGRFSALFASGDFPHTLALQEQLEKAGVPASHPRAPAAARLYTALRNLPRHLGQHSGGMILCRGRLSEIVPLENASMEGRVVAQWDKYDCEELGIIKVDLLGLGMMAVMQDCIELCSDRNRPVDLAAIPKDDPATYRLMQEADTIGVFQIESRAQMATLPRMKPRCFYDVVVEVAIIRPGPIQGDMVHPYLARRSGKEPVTYLHPDLEPVLKRTLGVALFQEQLLRIAMVIAGFSAAEAEELRRALSDLRSRERMERVCERLRLRMRERHHSEELIEHVIQSMRSFALYGFPESHAISFALIAYASAWMKVHRAPEFYAALLNNQPMGFYSSATLVRDARNHQVRMLPPSVLHSDWKCTVIDDATVRLGLALISGLPVGQTQLLLSEREHKPFTSLADFRQRVPLNRDELRLLARSGALQGLTEHRRDALWRIQEPLENDLFSPPSAPTLQTAPVLSVSESEHPLAPPSFTPQRAHPLPPPAPAPRLAESRVPSLVWRTPSVSPTRTELPSETASAPICPLRPMTPAERLASDYTSTGVTVGRHPMEFLRENLPEAWNARQIRAAPNNTAIETAGMVICRQRPGTAKGFVFLSLEDETGISNIIVPPGLYERTRLLIASESFLRIDGLVQQHEGVTHVRAQRIHPLPTHLPPTPSHDFH